MVGGDVGTLRRVYRVVAGDPHTPSTSAVRIHTVPPSVGQFQASECGESLPVFPESAARTMNYQMHPVRSETDFSRHGVVYSSEWRAPVNQYQGGPSTCYSGSGTSGHDWTVGSDGDQYNSRFYFCFFFMFQSVNYSTMKEVIAQ